MVRRKILIGTPICESKNYCWSEYTKAISQLIIPAGMEIVHFVVDTTDTPSKQIEDKCIEANIDYTWVSSLKAMDKVVMARNEIFQYAKNIKADYVLFIDSDVIVPPNTIQELLTGLAQYNPYWGVITGFYPITTKIGFPTAPAKLWTKIGYMDFPDNYLNSKIYEVDMTGLGLTLIPSKVFETFKFSCYRDKDGKLLASEDMVFFTQILNHRFCTQKLPVLFHTGLVAKHLIGGDFEWDHDKA